MSVLALAGAPVDHASLRLEGTLGGAPVVFAARRRAGPSGLLRVCTLRGEHVEIASLVLVPSRSIEVPVLAVDLVRLGQRDALVVADLGARHDERTRAVVRAHLRAAPSLPSAGALPGWAARYFSPEATFARANDDAATAAVVAAWVEAALTLFAAAPPTKEPDAAVSVVLAYLAAHRDEDRTLRLLDRCFGAAIARTLVHEVLFPATVPP